MLDLVFDLTAATGWTRKEVLGLGLSEARHAIARLNEKASK